MPTKYRELLKAEAIQFIARDGNGELFGYRTKPVKYIDSREFASDDNYSLFIEESHIAELSPFYTVTYDNSPVNINELGGI